MTFGEKTKVVREKLFMSQEDLAKALGVAYVTVSRWENGHCEPNYKAKKLFHELCVKNNIEFEG
jgi:DNA-binding transcriptional regulator YiaG